jgi:tetratricopeptide (TPR) repeat protein
MFGTQRKSAHHCHSSTRPAVHTTDSVRGLGADTGGWRVGFLLGCLAVVWTPISCEGDAGTAMAEVRALQDAGQYSASVDELRRILVKSPDLPEANYRFGIALAQTGNPSRAIWPLQKASESGDYEIPATLLIASVQFKLTNFEEAIRAANRVLETDGAHRVALTIRSQANLGIHHLDEALEDTSRLVASYPDDYQLFVVHATVLAEMGRMEEAEAAQFRIKEMSEASGDPRTAGRGCLAPPLFAKDNLVDVERAEELYADCASKYPADAFVITHIAGFFDSIGKTERATALIRTAMATAPDDLSLHATLANRLARRGEMAEAEAVLKNAVDQFGSASAWNLLVGHYRRQGNPARALEAIEKVAELTEGDRDPLRFTRADLLVDLGELDRAEAVAKTLEEPTYAAMIRGRILLSRGDASAALAAFDQGIAKWPNNAGARYLAGVAALRLGDFERAVVELRESVRVDDAATEAARVLARLYFERADFRQAIGFSAIARKRSDADQRAGDLELELRAWAALGEFDKARSAARALTSLPGQRGRAAAELALVERMATGPEAAVTAVENLGLDLTDPANEEALRSLADDWIALQQADRALSSIDAALKASPESASLHALHGTTLARTYKKDDARIAFERALEIDAQNAEALGGLAALIATSGDTARAIELFDRASEFDPNTARYPYAAARLLLAGGDRENAEARLRDIVRLFAGHVGSRNDLAWMLAEAGEDLDLALSLAEEASRMSSEPEILDTLGFVHLKRGESRKAVEVLDRAVSVGGASPSIHYRLGIALIQSGNTERAREMLNRALGAGPFPEAEAARRQLALLEKP